MKQVDFTSRHARTFDGYDSPDKSSMTEQNLRLSQAERAIDMANGRIPVIPPANIQMVDNSEILPDELQTMLGVYQSPMVDPATKSRVFERLRYAYADYISQREAEALEKENAHKKQKEDEYALLIEKLKQDIAFSGK